MVDIQLEFANPRQNGVTVFGSFLDDLLYVFPVHLVGDGGAQNVQGLFHALTAFRLGLEFLGQTLEQFGLRRFSSHLDFEISFNKNEVCTLGLTL